MQPGTARIMVVDDEPGVRQLLAETLSELGHVCLTASSGLEALDLLRAEQVDLILMDIVMPGMSGLTLFKRVRERYPDTAVIFATAMSDLEVAVEYLKQGAYDYLTKPITLKGLRQAIDDALRKRRLVLEEGRQDTATDSDLGRQLGQREREITALNRLFQELISDRLAVVNTYREVLEGLQKLAQDATALAEFAGSKPIPELTQEARPDA